MFEYIKFNTPPKNGKNTNIIVQTHLILLSLLLLETNVFIDVMMLNKYIAAKVESPIIVPPNMKATTIPPIVANPNNNVKNIPSTDFAIFIFIKKWRSGRDSNPRTFARLPP